jgi:purine nucleoside phosphorylase
MKEFTLLGGRFKLQSYPSLDLENTAERISYEIRAECGVLTMLGADLVWMSIIPKIIVARHCGVRVLGMSLVPNLCILKAGPHGDDPRVPEYTQQKAR